ncbi:hypothetical protein [Streptomyces sp. NPDC002889]|uniref:hypothetical protein n=1 Tax=Streptomyces sp. NPDC002889 TaxID=3364669 RepID=UPI0036C19AC3
MFEYEIQQLRQAELIHEAENQRLVLQARRARRARRARPSAKKTGEGRVSPSESSSYRRVA